MITKFEEYTEELSVKEREFLPEMVDLLKSLITIDNAKGSKDLCVFYHNRTGNRTAPRRIRAMVRSIRDSGEVENLVATPKGYFVNPSPEDNDLYIKGLYERSDSLRKLAEQMHFQNEKLKKQIKEKVNDMIRKSLTLPYIKENLIKNKGGEFGGHIKMFKTIKGDDEFWQNVDIMAEISKSKKRRFFKKDNYFISCKIRVYYILNSHDEVDSLNYTFSYEQ